MAEGGAEGKAKRVMVAIDESESSHYALEWVLSNLRSSLSSSSLVVFTVQPYPEISYLNAASFGPPRMSIQARWVLPSTNWLVSKIFYPGRRLDL